MRIWVDADACPAAIKEILYRAAGRREIEVILVANKPLHTPRSPWIRAVQVPGGFDVADRHIAEQVEKGDVVITADVPLAAKAIERGGHAINPRGELYTAENIGERLAVRDFMDELRSGGTITGGPSSFGKRDREKFANQLDRLLARRGEG